MSNESEPRIYRIDATACTACYECLRVCDVNAIRKVSSDVCGHCQKYCLAIDSATLACTNNKMCIDETTCTACGRCLEVCPHDAIITMPRGGAT
jgi:ferredoxin